jgi:hypothetical protein
VVGDAALALDGDEVTPLSPHPNDPAIAKS